MSDDQKPVKEIQGHSYDGITELDNPLPAWWFWTFIFTIIFAALYYLHYEIANGPTLKQELTVALAEIEKNEVHNPAAAETEESLEKEMQNPSVLALGASVFSSKCAVCHGAQLQGQIGPNLTDKFWIHGKGNRVDILNTIRVGVADKGMPPWGAVLKSEELHAVADYVYSKIGSQPANPKEPQGQKVE